MPLIIKLDVSLEKIKMPLKNSMNIPQFSNYSGNPKTVVFYYNSRF